MTNASYEEMQINYNKMFFVFFDRSVLFIVNEQYTVRSLLQLCYLKL